MIDPGDRFVWDEGDIVIESTPPPDEDELTDDENA